MCMRRKLKVKIVIISEKFVIFDLQVNNNSFCSEIKFVICLWHLVFLDNYFERAWSFFDLPVLNVIYIKNVY